MEPTRRTPFSDAELAEFRDLLLQKRAATVDDVEQIRARLRDAQQADSDSSYASHMADAGSDAGEREQLYASAARLQAYLGHVDRALARIDAGTYGLCKVTGEPIPRERLLAVPHTETSIQAKRDEQSRRS